MSLHQSVTTFKTWFVYVDDDYDPTTRNMTKLIYTQMIISAKH